MVKLIPTINISSAAECSEVLVLSISLLRGVTSNPNTANIYLYLGEEVKNMYV